MSASAEQCRLGAIVGPARSGTTWAGTIVDSSPDAIYRFEPFHRLSRVSADARMWMDRLKAQSVSEADLEAIYAFLHPADPLTNKAPFFRVKNYEQRTFGRASLWPVARVLAPARALYRAAYTPQPGPRIVFKEVTFVRQLRNLIERTSVPIVYLVRHPCATILSGLASPQEGAIAGRHKQLRALLESNASHLIERFPDAVDDPDPVVRNALLWLYEVESCVSMARMSQRVMVLTYEQLAADGYEYAKSMFAHLGIRFGEETRRYLDSLYGVNDENGRAPKRTGWSRSYFSVHRNPRKQKDAWKEKASVADQSRIEAIVQGSEAVQLCSRLGKWW